MNYIVTVFNMFNATQFISAFVVLFAVIDIIGTLPIAIKLRKSGHTVSAKRASFASLVLFIGFMYLGDSFLNLFGLDIASFAVAGSIIIFIIAMEMILDINIFRKNSEASDDATFTPIVFPLIAGAGSFTTLLSIRSQYTDFNIILAIITNVIIIYLTLKSINKLEKWLSPAVICIFQKAFGIILLSISVKLFTSNLADLVSVATNG